MISGGLNKVLQNDVSPVVICSAVLIWLIAFPPCLPAQPLQIDATRQLDLADHFYDIQAYRDAVTEYRKFRFFFPDHDRAAYARFRIAMAFFKQKDYETAVVYFERIAGATYAGEYSIEACFMASRCYTAMGSSARAVANLKALLEVTSDPAITDRAWHEIGWINLDTARPLTESAYENARLAFFNISHPGREQYGIADLLVHLDWAQYDPDGLTATMKSPGLAGGLAVIPGAGYLYTNRYQDALVAFLFNAGMIIAAYEAFDNGNEALGAIIASVELGFYAGNIYGSISAAHKHNRYQSDQFLRDLHQVPEGPSAIRVSLGLPF